jgi:hypothetical protein
MTCVGRLRLFALALCALLAPSAAFADGTPTPCHIVANVATCSLDDSEGITFTTVAAAGTSIDPHGITSIVTSGLTKPIAPDGFFAFFAAPGIGLVYDLSKTNPTDATTVGISGPALSVTTDNSQPINITGSSLNNTFAFSLSSAIVVHSVGGSGYVPPPYVPFSSPGGPGGDAGAGGDVTVTNHAALTLALTNTPQSRAVALGLGDDLSNQIGARDFANAALDCLNDASCAASPNPQLSYFQCYFGGGAFVLFARICVGGSPVSDAQLKADIQNQVLAPIQDRIDYLNAPPAPGETGSFVIGAITATSTGGTGGSTSEFSNPHGRRSGNGGVGGDVTVVNTAPITIMALSGYTGGNSAGIVAISSGGQAGNGFDNFDSPLPAPSGFGGDGGTVLVTNSGAITTTVVSTPGIFAESIGGNQGDHTVATGSAGGSVTVNNTGAIVTTEINSYGLFAKSQGGGNIGIGFVWTGGPAGHATINNDAAITTSGDFAYGAYAVSAGGKGGDGSGSGNGADGGPGGTATITLDVHSLIVTSGKDAIGAYALSIAGIGGVGGSDSGIFWADAGGGGSGGKGGDAFVTNKGSIATSGAFAYGVFGQSLGGTGGIGGSAGALVAESGSGGGGAPAGNVTLENDAGASITTTGANAYGMYAQSLAGSGGDAGSSGGFVALGSDGGNGAQAACIADPTQCLNGGTVTITNAGSILTQGVAADGILGESIGGGGGNGGNASGLFSYGGSGGAGGNGGLVVINNVAGSSITTTGDTAVGIFAQSVGGGGGKGGNATSFGTGASVAIGGSGGSGGFGNTVTVTNNGAILDSGLGVTGIFAQSVGGGGGAGGDASATSLAISVSIGGSGGGGGKGGAVTVTNDVAGSISVNGFASTGIFAQSVGGGGGKGGSATSLAVGLVGAVSVAIGGHGADGGGAGDLVSVTNAGSIATTGDFSDAVFVQSVGGGGGAGGSAFATSAAVSVPDVPVSVSASIGVGGKGGNGGDGGVVSVVNSGSIQTFDWDSRGIFAQSVGGGGGNGGSSAAKALSFSQGTAIAGSVAVGGGGGEGGQGKAVGVTNTGSITTFGDQSDAVFAQSVGGGGGNGGDASTTTYTLTAEKSANVNVSVGGSGGNGNIGGAVTVINSGSIIALGNGARAVVAQSVGGGGGNGGAGTQQNLFDFIDLPTDYDKDIFNKSLKDQAKEKFNSLKMTIKSALTHPGAFGKKLLKDQLDGLTAKPQSVGVSIGIGGAGGSGDDGGIVTVTNSNEIITGGFMGFGIFAQSVGGGGGSGGGGDASGSGDVNVGGGFGGSGGGGGNGNTVGVTNTGDITTFGDMAYAIFAQSVGGGGGVGGAGGGSSDGVRSASVSIGGGGTSAGDGLGVTVLQNGNIVTVGDNAIGVLAQSVGGGGGVGGTATAPNSNNVSVGGTGGAGGNGGDLNVMVDGSIATLGNLAHGVFAQSVGGGGGLGGAVEASTLEIGIAPLGLYKVDTGVPVAVGVVGVAGSGGGGGNGGAITLITSGTISTSGRGADGIFAQSIGGGGGSGGTSSLPLGGAIPINGSNGGLGIAGKIAITHTGSIFATGVDANGIVAQSMGGSAERVFDKINNVFTAGAANPDGLGDNITITLLGKGIVSGGTGAAAGIVLAGGKDNLIDNEGGTITALSGLAILGGAGNDVVVNNGLVQGTIGLGGGTNSFHNGVKGTFESGQFVYINAGSTLLNDGVLSPGGAGFVRTTTMTGNLTDTLTATLLVDVNFKGGSSDLVTMDGTASLAGKVLLGPHHTTDLVVGSFVTVLSASSIVNNGISIDDTLTVDYGLRVVGGNLQVGVNSVAFVLPGAVLTPDETAIAQQLQEAWQGGGGGLTPLLDLVAGITDSGAYSDAIGALDPAPGTTLSSALLSAAISFTSSLMSCPGSSDPEDTLHEHECYWGRVSGFEARQDPTPSSFAYADHGERIQLGRQFAVAPQWFVGASGGYQYDSIDAGPAVRGSNRLYSIGLVTKREDGPWTVAVAVDGSYGDGKLSRAITLPTAVIASSAPRQLLIDGKLRASYLARSGWFYAKPSLEGDLYYLSVSGFHETGAGPLDVITRTRHKLFGSGSIGLEFGGIFQDTRGSVFRPYVSGGILAYTEHRWDVMARFEGSPAGVPDFKVSNSFPGVLGRLTAGIDASMGESTAKLEYEAHFGSRYVDQTGSVKLELRL